MKMIIHILICLSVLIGGALSLHLSNGRTGERNSGVVPPIMTSVSGTLQQHVSNPYRRMAGAAEPGRERMLFMGGGRRGRPIVTGRVLLTTEDTGRDYTSYPASSLTMLQDNEFPIRREPFFFVGDDDDGGDAGVGGGGDGGGYEEFQKPKSDLYHHYDDGSYEIMEDIFNRGEGMYRKYPPTHHQPLSVPHFDAQSPRGYQDLLDHHEMGHELPIPNHRPGGLDVRIQQNMQRKRTHQKQNLEIIPSPPVSKSTTPTPSTTATINSGASSSLGNQKEQKQQQANQQQASQHQGNQQQQLLHRTTNNKRSGMNSGIGAPPPVTHSIASQLMLRTARGQRQYDVPQIECPSAIDGMERFACPTPDLQGRYRCIDDHVLCDGFIDCPEGEDEDRRSCMFYKTTKAHLDVLADALLRWARGR